MSKREAIDVNELMLQYEAVKSEISQLRSLISQLLIQKDGIEKAKSSIDTISNSKSPDEVIFPLDPGYMAMIFARPVDKNQYIIYLGADVYAKLNSIEAMKILTEREGELNQVINNVNQRLLQLENLREQYEAILQQVATEIQKQGK
ncbi:MAG: prefoldin subunit alpha [Caldisphaeraceae archaeon]|nr:prefoldin subunit alpha [Caldisphaeraceae archaeon]MEB2792748.1 prefoldin subunit alpha [Caldisphaeraceae archaeon]MEB3692048.1 prefoldin subunit alpha [Caldisphaeraceae archaeon]MEB3797242.1 prefoldin subunit alpha [Caldisphaeraceae archaeon]